jgi:hypothetical protein
MRTDELRAGLRDMVREVNLSDEADPLPAVLRAGRRRRTTRRATRGGAGLVVVLLALTLFALVHHLTAPAHVVTDVPTSAGTSTTTLAPPAVVDGLPLANIAQVARAVAAVYGDSHPDNIRVAVASERAMNRLIVNGTPAYNFGSTDQAYVLALDGHFSCKVRACPASAKPASTIALTLNMNAIPTGALRFVTHPIDLASVGHVYVLDAYPGVDLSSAFGKALLSAIPQTPSPLALPTQPVRACRFDDLAFDFGVGGAGAGNDFAGITIRNVSTNACTYQDPVDLVGVDAHGHNVTQTVHYTVASSVFLSAHTARASAGEAYGPDAAVGSLSIIAEYRDDPNPKAPGGLCQDPVVPASFRLTLPGGTVTLANVKHGQSDFPPALITCRGQLGSTGPIRSGSF